ncbi:Site-specific recombinase XerD [Variovorax sp. HW608]|uniref:site-specific integrase n=1 Tax=Variovorax sp. HW608 TaxID=1034889 RepID=UPI00081FEB3E|nr:site-specific integrase [Variovorax sp. HW608]SCK11284.1 Site-specific recombinase XerD [Variovorax sp. HW608]
MAVEPQIDPESPEEPPATMAGALPAVPLEFPVLDPAQLSRATEESARALMRQGESANTRASYRAAMRYWAAWYAARYGSAFALPVPVPVVVQFIVDHAARIEDENNDAGTGEHEDTADIADVDRTATQKDAVTPSPMAAAGNGSRTAGAGTQEMKLVWDLPPAIDQLLNAQGYKGKLGPMALATLEHRVAVISKAHQNLDLDNPCGHTQVRELLKRVRAGHAKRNVRPHKQAALTKEPLQALLDTCDESPRGKRDRALLLFAWSSGGRRRSEVAGATMENLRKIPGRGYLYTLGRSKSNQEGRLDHTSDKPIKGVAAQALDEWLTVSGILEGPIFRRLLRGGVVTAEALEPRAVRLIVKERCLKAGLDAEKFSAHSLRSGFVTEAGRRKVSAPEAMALTGHRSYESFMGYYRAEDPLDSEAGGMLDD